MSSEHAASAARPSSVVELEQVFGASSQSGFGTAVFCEPAPSPPQDFDTQALATYRYFAGSVWDSFGPENWLAVWKLIHARGGSAPRQITTELSQLSERVDRSSAAMLMDNHEHPEAARHALAAAFDDPAVEDLRVYRIGDGSAMSGLLIGARRSDHRTVFLVFLMD